MRLLTLLCPDYRVRAQWSTDPNVNNPICTTPSRYRSDLKMVSDGAGGAFLTWTGQTSPAGLPGTSLDVYAQRIDSSGLLPWGSDEAVLANSRLDQRLPFITSDDSGGANITWGVRPFNPGLQNSLVFCQRLGANGTPHWALGGEFLAAPFGDMYYYVPVSTGDGGGGVITAFQYGVGSSSFLMSTRIKASGAVQPLNGFWEGLADQRSLAINSDGVGGAIVAWALSSNIYAQRIDTSGVVHWNTNGVAILTGGSQRVGVPPTIMSDGAGGAIIAWLDSRTSYGIYAQRVDSAGVVQWTTNGVPVTTAANIPYEPPALVSDNAGGAIIAWRDTSSGMGIRVQRVTNAGVVLWDSSGVTIAPTPSLGPDNSPAIAADGVGGVIITWSDMRNGASNTDIYAQRVNASGVVQWTANGVAISTATGDQSAPQIVTNGGGDAIIAWLDLRNAGGSFQPAEIYGQRVNANGQLGGTTDAPDNGLGTPGAFKLNQSYPNPFNPTTTFTFSIPRTGKVLLNVYNVLGQEVATVVNETLNAGSYSRTFNAAGLASGAYFYRLNAGGFSETKRMLLVK